MEIKPPGNDKIIPAKRSKKIYLTWQTNFINGNMMAAFGNGTLTSNPALQGRFGFDLGYGMIELPFNFPITFKVGN